jgi:hypothetical protein
VGFLHSGVHLDATRSELLAKPEALNAALARARSDLRPQTPLVERYWQNWLAESVNLLVNAAQPASVQRLRDIAAEARNEFPPNSQGCRQANRWGDQVRQALVTSPSLICTIAVCSTSLALDPPKIRKTAPLDSLRTL